MRTNFLDLDQGFSYPAQASTIFTRLTNLSPPSPASFTRKLIIGNAVQNLISAGIWDQLDLLYVFAAHSRAAALVNWVSPNTILSEFGSPTHEVDKGFTGNQTDWLQGNALNTYPKFNAIQNKFSAGAWCMEATTASGAALGVKDNGTLTIMPRNSNNLNVRANNPQNIDHPTPSSKGLVAFTRSADNLTTAYRNGAFARTSNAAAALTVTTSPLVILRDTSMPGSAQIAAVWIGGELSAEQHKAMYGTLLSYLQALGTV